MNAAGDGSVETDDSLEKGGLLTLALISFAAPAMAHPHHTSQSTSAVRAPSHIDCTMARAYVGETGLVRAREMAPAAGMTAAQERKAQRCLAKKI